MISSKDFPLRGSVYLVNLDPTIGREIKKTRPVVIIQNDIGNQFSPLTIIAPITTTQGYPHPVHVKVQKSEGGLDKDSVILLDQIRTVDRQRLIKFLGKLSEGTMEKIDRALKMSLALDQ